jgi:N-acetylmuramoyl-L-alanine amidase
MTAIWKGAHPRNFSQGRAGHRPEAIVIHIMDGTLVGTDSWFNDVNSKVSAHYGVGKAGAVHQYVKETDTAQHAGVIVRPTWRLLKPRTNPNFYTIGIEHEGFGLPPSAWPEPQLAASTSLVAEIAQRWSIPVDEDHIIPHRAIRASKPNCPGIDMDAYIARVAGTPAPGTAPSSDVPFAETVRILRPANLRRRPRTDGTSLRTLIAGDTFDAVAKMNGESVGGNDLWFRNAGNDWLWAGNTDRPHG